jgi:purine nucleosidase
MCGVPVVIIGLDVTQSATLTPRLLDEWLGGRTDLRAQFLRCLCQYEFSRLLRTTGVEGLYLHDPLTVAIALDKSLARTRKMKMDVEISGEITTGLLVAERRSWVKGGENVEVCLEVNVGRFLEEFRRRVFDVTD